jgi:hypothetical protein
MIRNLFNFGYSLVVILFYGCALALVCLSGLQFWRSINPALGQSPTERFNSILECIGLITIAAASLQLGQIVLEEEIQRSANVSVPTRARRYLSRFLVVIIISLAIETLVSVFQLAHDKPEQLPYTAWIGLTAAALLVAWGLFIKMNKSVEELEPEALAEAKREDKQIAQAAKE